MKTDPIELLKDLIKIRSYSGQEMEIAKYIKEKYKRWGLGVIETGGNLIVPILGINKERAFIFNSHMDTVTAGDDWKYGPLNPTLENGKMFGLGASDMKSGISASMLLAEYYSKNTPPCDVYFTYSTNEEVDGSGSKNIVEWFETNKILAKYSESAVILTEPTELTFVENGHMGNIFLKLTLKGESSHGSRPIENVNHVVYKMMEFNNLLEVEYKKWAQRYETGDLFPPTMAKLISIWANVKGEDGQVLPDSPNKYPSVCYATIDLRTIPGFHEEVVNFIRKFALKYGVEVEFVAEPAPCGLTPSGDRLVRAALSVIKSTQIVASKASADLGFFTEKGIKAIILGPGIKEQCHRKNEYCDPEQIAEAAEIYKEIVRKWLES